MFDLGSRLFFCFNKSPARMTPAGFNISLKADLSTCGNPHSAQTAWLGRYSSEHRSSMPIERRLPVKSLILAAVLVLTAFSVAVASSRSAMAVRQHDNVTLGAAGDEARPGEILGGPLVFLAGVAILTAPPPRHG